MAANAEARIDSSRALLRHTVATVAYRGGKALRAAPGEFANFRVAAGTRTPAEILAHVGDLFDWALSIAKDKEEWRNSSPLPWNAGVDRFFTALNSFDAYLASDAPLGCSAERLFQGPIADSLTHIGQISMLRRLASAPVRGEDYSQAEIALGRVGREQKSPKFEFD